MFLPALHDERLVPGTAIGCNPKDPNQINPTTFLVTLSDGKVFIGTGLARQKLPNDSGRKTEASTTGTGGTTGTSGTSGSTGTSSTSISGTSGTETGTGSNSRINSSVTPDCNDGIAIEEAILYIVFIPDLNRELTVLGKDIAFDPRSPNTFLVLIGEKKYVATYFSYLADPKDPTSDVNPRNPAVGGPLLNGPREWFS